MPAKSRHSHISVIRQQYVLPDSLRGLISFFLRQALTATRSSRAFVCLPGWELSGEHLGGQHAVVGVGEDGRAVEGGEGAACDFCAPFDASASEEAVITGGQAAGGARADSGPPEGAGLLVRLRYQRKGVGVMALSSDGPRDYSQADVDSARLVADELVRHLKRYEFNWLARVKMGRDLPLVGVSESMRAVDNFIEKASRVNLPAFITGELGCEKRSIACAVHLASSRRAGPLVMVNCAAIDPETSADAFSALYASSHGGTIVFQYLDDLPSKLYDPFLALLGSGTGALMLNGERASGPDARIISTSNKDVQELDKGGRFYQTLLRELNFINLRVAPLRERKEDFEHLARYFLREYEQERARDISDGALSLLREYTWPYNDSELKQVIARLAVMTEGDVITARDVDAFAPHLTRAQGHGGASAEAAAAYLPPDEEGDEFREGAQLDARVVQLARRLSKGECDQLQHFHSSLRKALEYLAANFCQKISLNSLARHACLSPSHLSFLFRKGVGVNFKTLLTVIRIERAKQLLLEQPHLRVTDISAEVGYEELSHFERTFKRFVYCSPREFRQRF